VLDLFAGTGALGLEAASRGAGSVTFVEQERSALECLDKNTQTFRRNRDVTCALSVARVAVDIQMRRLAASGEIFTLIFADPPYGEMAQDLLDDEELPRLLASEGLLVLESAKRDALAVGVAWEQVRGSVYGDTQVIFLRRAMASADAHG
jgi:16S rRNA (guanine966-N2)-methyltransferase